MPENGHVRFGGGPWEKGSYEYLACGLPYKNLCETLLQVLQKHQRAIAAALRPTALTVVLH
jgi:hypothetical protein